MAIQYRAFRNTDPPGLADIWRARAHERGLVQQMSVDLIEQLVLSKPYFDRNGLIVAMDAGRPVGFAHAGFGPSADESSLAFERGVICMLMVHPESRRLGIGTQLLLRSEEYLVASGAKTIYGGGIQPLTPFYLGLYGGSELPGVLDSDADAQRRYRAQGYEEVDRTLVFHRELSSFRPPVNRQQMQLRRTAQIVELHNAAPRSWWDACTYGSFARTRFELYLPQRELPVARLTAWSMDELASSWGVRAVGLIDLAVDPELRRQGAATFLVSEAMRRLSLEGWGVAEVQTQLSNVAGRALFERLGFATVDQGAVYRKSVEMARPT